MAGISLSQGAQIIDSSANIALDKCSLVEDKYVLAGAASVGVLYKNEGEIGYSDVNIPIRYQWQAESKAAPVSFDVSAQARNLRVKLSEENRCVDAEISACVDCFGASSANAVERVIFGGAMPARDSELIVCYPSTQDCVWSVAKRYAVAPADILGDPATDKYVIIE